MCFGDPGFSTRPYKRVVVLIEAQVNHLERTMNMRFEQKPGYFLLVLFSQDLFRLMVNVLIGCLAKTLAASSSELSEWNCSYFHGSVLNDTAGILRESTLRVSVMYQFIIVRWLCNCLLRNYRKTCLPETHVYFSVSRCFKFC